MTALDQLFTGDISAFNTAFRTSRADAMAALFYVRDPQGLGRREPFRTALSSLADNYALAGFIPILSLIPHYGRWDDLLIFGAHRSVGIFVQQYVTKQWAVDRTVDKPSLLAKYLPSENASSQATKLFSDIWIRALYNSGRGMPDMRILNRLRKQYRKDVSAIRAKLPIVERLMSAGEWSKIDYATLPHHAINQYHSAFLRHDRARYCAFLATLDMPFIARPIHTISILRTERYARVYEYMGKK